MWSFWVVVCGVFGVVGGCCVGVGYLIVLYFGGVGVVYLLLIWCGGCCGGWLVVLSYCFGFVNLLIGIVCGLCGVVFVVW